MQRDLYSAFLLAYLEPEDTIPSISLKEWEGAELRLRAEMERLQQRANERQTLPRSFGIPKAGARRLEILEYPRQELFLPLRGEEASGGSQEPPPLMAGESQKRSM